MFFRDEILHEGHTCDFLASLPRYKGKNKTGKRIQVSLQYRVCSIKYNSYCCVQCTCLRVFSEIFACHDDPACQASHLDHIKGLYRRDLFLLEVLPSPLTVVTNHVMLLAYDQ